MIKQAVRVKGKGKVRDATLVVLAKGFSNKVGERIRQNKSVEIDVWFSEYISSADYKKIDQPIYAELGITDKDIKDILKRAKKDPSVIPIPASKPFAGTGRNSSCPCGSGKKYKKCCGV